MFVRSSEKSETKNIARASWYDVCECGWFSIDWLWSGIIKSDLSFITKHGTNVKRKKKKMCYETMSMYSNDHL